MEIKRSWKRRFDQLELLTREERKLNISLENWQVENIAKSRMQKSALRVIEDGSMGENFSLGRSEKAAEELVRGAEQSVQYGDKAVFSFSDHSLNSFHEKEEKNYRAGQVDEIILFLEDVVDFFKSSAPDITLNLSFGKSYDEIQMETSRGAYLKDNQCNFSLMVSIPVSGGGSQFYRSFESSEMFSGIPEAELDQFLREFRSAGEVSRPETGKMPVIFSPRSLYLFTFSLQEGLRADNVFKGISPLIENLDTEIFSPRISVIDSPHMQEAGGRRFFDDEGIPTRRQKLVDEGVFKSFIYDQEHAARMNARPGGNGLRRGLFSSGIETPISPGMVNPTIEPGESSRDEMISSVENGILVENIVGFHSSNYSQGHFSVQAHGYHVREGKLQGRLEDVMIAGNIYDDFQKIKSVGRKLYPGRFGYYPYLLCPDIQVSSR